jgi:hypothetical protein
MAYAKMSARGKAIYLEELRSGEFKIRQSERLRKGYTIIEFQLDPRSQHALLQPYQGQEPWTPIEHNTIHAWLNYKFHEDWTYYDIADWIEQNL